MAKQKENSSYYSGKVGAVVECQWKGIRYIRSLPAYINDPKTPAQLTQRSKFKEAHRFVKTMLCTVKIGYANFAVRQTAYNACLSHTLRYVAKGENPNVTLDYSKALLGEGALATAENCTINIIENRLQISWNSTQSKGNANGSDTTLVALYCVERNQALQLFDSAQRANGMVTVNLPTEWHNCTIQCFMGFRSIDKKNISNIGHIGQIDNTETLVNEKIEPTEKTLFSAPLQPQIEDKNNEENDNCDSVKTHTTTYAVVTNYKNMEWEKIYREVKRLSFRTRGYEAEKIKPQIQIRWNRKGQSKFI